MSRWTLRARLTALYGAVFVLAGIVLLALTYLLVGANLDRQLRADEDERVAAARAEAAGGDGTAGPDDIEALVDEVRAGREDLRDAALDSVLTQGALALLGVGVAAVGLGWLVAGRALQPVHTITETARRIATAGAGRGLHERIALAGPQDEVKGLADTFDAMLEHLDRAFDGQRRFVANASHELRTPLALNRALVELAVTEPDAGEDTRRLGRSLLQVNERHERLIDGLLTLAESESAVTDRRTVDLAEVAAHVLDAAGATAAEAGVEARRALAPALVAGEPTLVERVVQNLVDNAVRHNHAGGWLSVTTGVGDDGRAVLTVANTGPVIAAYDVAPLFEPFRRLGDRRPGPTRGFGLGLSIVRAVARAHDGDATAAPRPGGGLVVTVTLPPAPAEA